eukprot:GHVS01008896.1.p1 GENE.GHVS01008896.1~~GHVS01008896.1.p1  ORF type:complete len:387 (-),score=34.48 GHVS01008896.1:263-1423(-)
MRGIETVKHKRGNPMGNKAAGFPGCFLVVLFVAIGLTLSLKANADTNILVMDLDGTANSNERNAETDCSELSSDTQTALRAVITNNNIASEDMPIFVVTAGRVPNKENSAERLTFIAKTFGVTEVDVTDVKDIANELEVNDLYSKDGSWPIRGCLIKKSAQWCDETSRACAKSTTDVNKEPRREKNKTCHQTVDRNIFLVSSKDVDKSSVKHCVFVRVIDFALQVAIAKGHGDGDFTVHTIGNRTSDLVGQSAKGEIWFVERGATHFRIDSEPLKGYTLHQMNTLLNTKSSEQLKEKHVRPLKSSDWNDVRLTDLTIDKMKKKLKMKPVNFNRAIDSTLHKRQFVTHCLAAVVEQTRRENFQLCFVPLLRSTVESFGIWRISHPLE